MEKAVTFHLNPVTVVVNGKDTKELLENAQKAFIEQIQKKFPSYQYGLGDADVLTMEQALPGTIVQTADNGRLGIITAKNPKSVNVTLKGGIPLRGDAGVFKLSDASFSDARSIRPDWRRDEWNEGDSGYLKVKGGEIKEVVVGKKKSGKTQLFVVNGGGVFYPVTDQQLANLLKDNRE